MDNRLLQLGVFAVSVAGYVVLAVFGEATAKYVAPGRPRARGRVPDDPPGAPGARAERDPREHERGP